MKLRVWHIPQIPMEPFYVNVDNLESAKLVLDTLARYDMFEFEKNIKPDYSNTSGLEILEGDEWIEWEDDDGRGILDIIDEEEAA